MHNPDADSYYFGQVPSTAASEAFQFHQSVASSDEHIWPRTEQQIYQYANDGQLFGVRSEQSGPFMALCYVALNSAEKEFELGGLTVARAVQRMRIGTVLARLALAYTMVYEQPWRNDQEVIAHVHEENQDPRKLLKTLGFEYLHPIELPGNQAPPSMKRNPAGNVVGDKFRFTRDGLQLLSNWFNQEFSDTRVGGAKVVVDMDLVTFDYLKKTLTALASEG